MALVLLTTQVAVNLTTATAVTVAGHDAVRRVAAAGAAHDPSAAQAARLEGERKLRDTAERTGTLLSATWAVGPNVVTLTVRVTPNRVAPQVVTRPVGLDVIERTFVARIEQVR